MIRTFLVILFSLATAFADQQVAIRSAADGEAAFADGDYPKAIELFTKAIEEDDTNPSFYANRGSAYSYLGKLDEALADYDTATKKAIALTGDPKDKRLAYFLYNRGYAYENAGRIKEALAEYGKTIALDPDYPDAHGNSAWILATHPDAGIREPKKALEYALIEAKRVAEATSGVLDTLAAAYAANGRYEEAVRHQKQAVSKADSPEEKREFTERLDLYVKSKPFIESSK